MSERFWAVVHDMQNIEAIRYYARTARTTNKRRQQVNALFVA